MSKQLQKLKNSQGFKFAAIGGLNTILDFAILLGLTKLGAIKEVANIFSTGITFMISFVLNKKITFQSQNKPRRELLIEMAKFTIVTLIGLWGIQSGIIWLTTPVFHSLLKNSEQALIAAKLLATAFSLTWNFVLYKKFVFTDKPTEK